MKNRHPSRCTRAGNYISNCGNKKVSVLRIYFFAPLFFALASSSLAQIDSVKRDEKNLTYKNSIIFSGTDYTLFTPTYFQRRGVLGPLLFWRDEHIGIYYERKVLEKWSVLVGYNIWNNTPLYYDHPGQFTTSQSQEIKVRSIIWSVGYKRCDAFINYQIVKIPNQQLKVGLGASYTRGLNEIVDSIVVLPGYFDAEIFTHAEKKSYFGLVPNLNYDYLILRNRISIGFDIRYRKYLGFYYNGFETGCHLGVNI